MTDKKYPGLYMHVPFCPGKCPYCDFYSFAAKGDIIERYVAETQRRLEETEQCFDSVYFGGGTPDRIGADNIKLLLECVNFTPDAEITVECNPSDTGRESSSFSFETLREAGVNRISMGLQSAVDSERRKLGRLSGVKEAQRAIERIKNAEIENISLDVMLGIPEQTFDTLGETLDFCVSSGASHISAYILKIEENTPFYRMRENLNLPDDDTAGEMYLRTVDYLGAHGFKQYEISNFTLPGFESRHNLKYWRCEEYLGTGPAAHSFMNGRRFYLPADIDSYLAGGLPVDDGEGGDESEYVMLALRLCEGLVFEKYEKRFGKKVPAEAVNYARFLESKGLAGVSEKGIALTPRGFLVSNSVIAEMLERI